MSISDASKTLRQGAVNLLDEYMRVAPTNQAVLITNTGANTPGDVTILLAEGVPSHIAQSISEHAQKIEVLLSQAIVTPAASEDVVVVPKEDVKTSPDELHGGLDGCLAAAQQEEVCQWQPLADHRMMIIS